jgi:hypothetical protein
MRHRKPFFVSCKKNLNLFKSDTRILSMYRGVALASKSKSVRWNYSSIDHKNIGRNVKIMETQQETKSWHTN